MPPYDLWLQRPRRHPHLVVRAGHRLRRLARDPDASSANGSPAFGQYKPSETRRRLRAVGAAGARAVRRADRRVHVLPRHRDALPALRPARPPRRVARRRRPHEASSSCSSRDAPAQPDLQAEPPRDQLEPRERVDRDRVGRERAHVADDRARTSRGHLRMQTAPSTRKLIGAATDEFSGRRRSTLPNRPTRKEPTR